MASTKLEFRVAMPEDAALIQPLVRSAYRGEESRKGWTTEADLVTGERIDVAGIRAKIEDPNGRILMTTNEDGVLVACCEILRLNDDIAYFGLFAVDPQRQGGGLGRQVLKYAEDYCFREWEVQKLEMMVIGTRDELISWYVRRGYQKTG
ncbi:acyl-CoA N-acyltransferase, partial [Thozetella sp. PMI_491]